MAAKSKKKKVPRRRSRNQGLAGGPSDHKRNHAVHVQSQNEHVEAMTKALGRKDCSGAFTHLLLASREAGAASAEKLGFTPAGHAALFDSTVTRATKEFVSACPLPIKKRR